MSITYFFHRGMEYEKKTLPLLHLMTYEDSYHFTACLLLCQVSTTTWEFWTGTTSYVGSIASFFIRFLTTLPSSILFLPLSSKEMGVYY